MFCYQKNFSNPTLPVDEAQFWALVKAKQWSENIDKYRQTHDAALKRKLPAFIFQATFSETTSAKGKVGAWRKQAATQLTGKAPPAERSRSIARTLTVRPSNSRNSHALSLRKASTSTAFQSKRSPNSST